MKRLACIIWFFFAVIAMSVFAAFLLQTIRGKTYVGQQVVESNLPDKQEQVTEEEGVDDSCIRVVIKTTDYKSEFHDQVKITCDGGMLITVGGETKEYGKDEVFTVVKEDKLLDTDTIKVEPIDKTDKLCVKTIERTDGIPLYRGKIELFFAENGIVIINEVPLEEYLCGVVPSEMPASYEKDALKAQAICARSYAFNQMKNILYEEYGAHVDDSVSFQVYNNAEESATSTEAVQETAGEMLWYGNEVAKTYFYSTSSGSSTSIEAWGSDLVEENQYLKGVTISDAEGQDYETNQVWYRWSALIEKETLENLVEKNAGKEIGTLKNIEITKIFLYIPICRTNCSVPVE